MISQYERIQNLEKTGSDRNYMFFLECFFTDSV